MTFERLLRDSPRQTAERWAARADKEWRGRPAADFAVVLGDGASVGPFAATDSAQAGLPRPRRAPWVQLADLRGAPSDGLAEVALDELAGGAQGFRLGSGQLPALASARSQIRYDFLTVCVSGDGPRVEAGLDAAVEPAQRPGLRLMTAPISGGAAPVGDVVSALRTLLPALVSRVADPGNQPATLALSVPHDYLEAVTLFGAADLLWANVSAAAAGDAPVAPPRLIAEIAPGGDTPSPEAYLVDASVRAVAAVSAGVDALVIAPYSASRDHRRQARNLAHLLQLEAGMHDFGDALGGAAWFEEAIVAAAAAAWDPKSTAPS